MSPVDLVTRAAARPGVRRAGLPRLSGGADAGPAAPAAPRLIFFSKGYFGNAFSYGVGSQAARRQVRYASRRWATSTTVTTRVLSSTR